MTNKHFMTELLLPLLKRHKPKFFDPGDIPPYDTIATRSGFRIFVYEHSINNYANTRKVPYDLSDPTCDPREVIKKILSMVRENKWADGDWYNKEHLRKHPHALDD